MLIAAWGMSSLVPRPSMQLSSLAVRIMLCYSIHTASDNSCGGELGTRLGYVSSGDLHSFVSSFTVGGLGYVSSGDL